MTIFSVLLARCKWLLCSNNLFCCTSPQWKSLLISSFPASLKLQKYKSKLKRSFNGNIWPNIMLRMKTLHLNHFYFNTVLYRFQHQNQKCLPIEVSPEYAATSSLHNLWTYWNQCSSFWIWIEHASFLCANPTPEFMSNNMLVIQWTIFITLTLVSFIYRVDATIFWRGQDTLFFLSERSCSSSLLNTSLQRNIYNYT